MQTGIVRWFNNVKGYGFLSQDNGPDVFVHYSAIQHEGYKSLKEGAPVRYAIETGNSGKPQASNVVPLGTASATPPSAAAS